MRAKVSPQELPGLISARRNVNETRRMMSRVIVMDCSYCASKVCLGNFSSLFLLFFLTMSYRVLFLGGSAQGTRSTSARSDRPAPPTTPPLPPPPASLAGAREHCLLLVDPFSGATMTLPATPSTYAPLRDCQG
jgi:hypothetical protein